ncbi:hypothetical protein AAC387_Pa04g3043 [Persea americana]
MARSSFSGVLSSPRVDVIIDMGNPFLNLSLDGFLKIETVGALRVAAEESYHCVPAGSKARQSGRPPRAMCLKPR